MPSAVNFSSKNISLVSFGNGYGQRRIKIFHKNHATLISVKTAYAEFDTVYTGHPVYLVLNDWWLSHRDVCWLPQYQSENLGEDYNLKKAVSLKMSF